MFVIKTCNWLKIVIKLFLKMFFWKASEVRKMFEPSYKDIYWKMKTTEPRAEI